MAWQISLIQPELSNTKETAQSLLANCFPVQINIETEIFKREFIRKFS